MAWLEDMLKWLRLRKAGIYVSFPLPSFYRNTDKVIGKPIEDDMQQSRGTDWSPEDVPDVAVSREYKHGHPELIKRFISIATEYAQQFPGRTLLVTCVYRSPQEQQRLYKIGRFGDTRPRVTNCDGITNPSKHNKFPARALDVCVLEGGKACYDERLYWPLLPLAKKHGLVSGGSWTSFQDWPHLELPKDVA